MMASDVQLRSKNNVIIRMSRSGQGHLSWCQSKSHMQLPISH